MKRVRFIGLCVIAVMFLGLRLSCAPPGKASSGDLFDPRDISTKPATAEKSEYPLLVESDKEAIRPGARGEKVKVLQQFLKDVKLYDGEITGTYDSATVNAVKSFQRTFDLKANGVVGLKTAKAIQRVMQGNVT